MIIAAAQGFFLALLLVQKHRNLLANWLLSGMLVCYSFILLYLTIIDTGYAEKIPKIIILFTGLSFLVAPLQYLYAKYLVNFSEQWDIHDWIHGVPFLCIEILVVASFIFMPSAEVPQHDIHSSEMVNFFLFFNWMIILIGLIYVVLILRLILQYHKRIKNVFSSIERIQLDWLQRITYVTLASWLIFTTETVLLTFGFNLSNFDISSLMVGLSVYAMGYWGLMKSEIFTSPEVASVLKENDDEQSTKIPQDIPKNISLKYEKSGLSLEDASIYKDRILQVMEDERPYIDSTLTLNKLAHRLAISSHNLSEVINTQLRQNFYDFVNRYRIEQVKRDLVDPTKQNLTILAIALDAGFNSKASFNIVFKESTGQTPSEFRKANL